MSLMALLPWKQPPTVGRVCPVARRLLLRTRYRPSQKVAAQRKEAKPLSSCTHMLTVSLSHCLTLSLSHCLTVSLSHSLTVSLSHCPSPGASLNPLRPNHCVPTNSPATAKLQVACSLRQGVIAQKLNSERTPPRRPRSNSQTYYENSKYIFFL